MAHSHLIAVATYRRPVELDRLLKSLAASEGIDNAEIIVIDNDPAGSARQVVDGAGLPIHYAVEPRAGIAAARNRGLGEFDERFHGILFVDDDEWVSPDWYEIITRFSVETDADIVRGHVHTVLDPGAPRWARRGTLFQRPVVRTGTVSRYAATNNSLLVRDAWVRAGSPRFDEAFSASGGEDVAFFRALQDQGARIVACAEAVVFEDIPADRMSLRSVCRRFLRAGITDVAVARKHREPLILPALTGIPKSIVHTLLLGIDLLRGRGIRGASMRGILYQLGWILGLLGVRITSYRT